MTSDNSSDSDPKSMLVPIAHTSLQVKNKNVFTFDKHCLSAAAEKN
jgi:hypothetical protein